MKNNNVKFKTRGCDTLNFELLFCILRFKFCTSLRASREGGYTLIEMLTVVSIIALLMGTTLYNYSRKKGSDVILFETQKLAQIIRRAQNLALSPRLNGEMVNGFGVRMSVDSNSVFLFRDLDGDDIYDSGEEIEELILDAGVSIKELLPGSPLNILYVPPDPIVRVNGIEGVNGKITISLTNDISKTREIDFNFVGLVEVR